MSSVLSPPVARGGGGRPVAGAPVRPARPDRPPRTTPAPDSRPAATAALALLTLASAGGLFRVFSGGGWVVPVIVTVVVVHLLCWTLRRLQVPSREAVPAVGAGIVLLAAWTVLGRYTLYGVPTSGTWDHAVSALGDLGNEFASMVTPVRPTPAFELLAVGGAALAAATADWAAFRWRAPLVALLPGLAAFVFAGVSVQTHGRAVVVAAEVAAICIFLLIERATSGDRTVWFAGSRDGVGAWMLAAGGLVALAAVLAAALLSPHLAGRDGRGVLGWRSGFGADGGERIVPNPLVDLRTRLTKFADRPAFVVTSTVPSYWRLTSLDTFDGTTWTSTGSYGGFGTRLPGAPPARPGERAVEATFRIQELESVWLPAQFDPVSVQGTRHVTYDAQSNSLLTSGSTSPDLQYSVTSVQYLDTLSPAALSAAAPGTDPTAARNLALPASLADPIRELATAITTDQGSEYAKAVAIQDYLRSSRFSYSLDPPTDGAGAQALYNFLFVTRSGYCQQFAGAYAVLARAAGLPTRLAVGFATGTPVPGGAFQVRDQDLHTWPEVYFGSRLGWVPFEPTPGFSVPGTAGYAHTGPATGGPGTVTPPVSPTTLPASTGTTPPVVKPSTRTATPSGTAPGPHHRSGGPSAWWWAVPVGVAAWLAATGAAPLAIRRLRRRRAARSGSAAAVLNAWDEMAALLAWYGLRRRPDESFDEFARRASLGLRRLGVRPEWRYGGPAAVAAMAHQAAYARSVPDGLGRQADTAVAEVGEVLAAGTSRRRRWMRMWSPPPGAWRRLGGWAGP